MTRAIDVWQEQWDPYLQDIEVGFMKFLHYWHTFGEDPKLDYKNWVPPCIQCIRGESCDRGHFHRETLPNGKEQYVCEVMIHRIHLIESDYVRVQKGSDVEIPNFEDPLTNYDIVESHGGVVIVKKKGDRNEKKV